MRDKASGIGAEETALDDDVGRSNENAGIPSIVDHQPLNDAAAAAAEDLQADAIVADGGAVDFDQDLRIVAVGQRVRHRSRLGITIDHDRAGNEWELGDGRDRADMSSPIAVRITAWNVKSDAVETWIGVGAVNRV